jgi:hypothetical protein
MTAIIKSIMESLGCEEIQRGIWRHPDFKYDFDLSATGDEHVLRQLSMIFISKGFESCQSEMRSVLGLE